MNHADFIERVGRRLGTQNADEASQTVEVVLETLGERLSKTESENLAAQLPKELKTWLLRRQGHAGSLTRGMNPYPLDEFYNRVAARSDVRHSEAIRRAKAVVAGLREAVTQGELEDVLAELSRDYADLFA